MEVEESGLGEERVADKPLGARQMKEYYERGSGVNSSMRPGDHDPPSLRRPVVSFPDYKNTTITLEFKTLSYTPF